MKNIVKFNPSNWRLVPKNKNRYNVLIKNDSVDAQDMNMIINHIKPKNISAGDFIKEILLTGIKHLKEKKEKESKTNEA